MKLIHQLLITAACALTFPARADTSFTNAAPIADAFLSGNAPSSNFGGAGTLVIAPANLSNGAYDSVMQFNSASAVSQFNTTYGTGNWAITGMSLMLASTFGTAGTTPNNSIFNNISGGNFGIDWLATDSWVEGTGNPSTPSSTGVNFNSVSGLLAGGNDVLGTFTYAPPGNNVYESYSLPLDTGLVSDAASGGAVSLLFFAADNQINYLINSRTFASAKPELIIAAGAVPEPSTVVLLAVSLGGLLLSRRLPGQLCPKE